MRFPRTNFSNMAMGFPQEDENETGEVSGEARKTEELALRRALLEQKLLEAREAKRQAEAARQQEAQRAQPVQAAAPIQQRVAPQAPSGTATAARAPTAPAMPLVPPLVPAGAVGAPAWQTAFSLAPNVRFTRTPESQMTRRNAPAFETPAPVQKQETRLATTADQTRAIAPSQPVMERKPAPILVETKAAVAQPSTAVAQPSPQVIAPAPLQALKAPQQPIRGLRMPFIQAPPESVAPTEPSRQTMSQLTYLSDFAFFDVMPLDGELSPMTAIAPSPVQPRPAPVIRLGVSDILSHFRIVDIRRPSQPGAELPVAVSAPLPVEPVQPAAQPLPQAFDRRPVPVAENPPAAILPVEVAPPVFAAPAFVVAPVPQAIAPAVEPAPAVAQPKPTTRTIDLRPQPARRRGNGLSPAPAEWQIADGGMSEYEFPPRELLQEPVARTGVIMTQETLEQNAGLLESVLEDFGVKGEIIHVRPGPVVTLYEFEPAPGVKSSRVIGLADDIARSMSALSARVAVVPGRNVIGIELPNVVRETVYFRELIEAQSFESTEFKLALCLGKNIGGEPIIAELAKMPHLLVAGTTGSGKSVAINTMILSLLYRLTPEQCRLIMVDPKMLELSVYDGIPHLLTPVVTDPKKAVMALKWAVREMEDRYRKMSRLGVRNIDGYNARVGLAREKGETINVMVQTGFDKGTGAPIEESQEMDLTPMPYIVVIVDEMADLMMVAGKEIEGAIQRLAQMARAAGIHLIMATQRPSVDVITGTIKANFPTRISFQVTSKIDSRTILGEQGAEQLLGQGDMLHMAGGGRISRVHGPFVSDEEVEKVVAHLKTQGRPEYLDTVTAGDDDEEDADEGDSAVFDKSAMGAEDGDDLYEQAIKVVMRDKKCSTSYIQRRLGIGYNRAASLVERMEKEGLVGPANHVGKREIVSGNRNAAPAAPQDEED